MEKLSNFSRQEKISVGKINDRMKEIEIAFQLPGNIKGKVSQLYLKAKRKRLLKGRDLKTIFAACLGIAIKEQKIPLTIKDITDELDVSFKTTKRLMKIIAQKLQIKILPIEISSFIDKFCFELNLSNKVKSKAEEILRKATKAKLTNGPSPQGIAAAVVYIAAILSGEHRTQDEMSKIIGVTEVTIRNRYKEIAKELDIDVFI
jgi:transcription initiation factor TFIIB